MSWESHLEYLRALFERLLEFGLTINLSKSEVGQATINYLGYIVGDGDVAPIQSKVQGIFDFKIPENKKALMRFPGMASYYRRLTVMKMTASNFEKPFNPLNTRLLCYCAVSETRLFYDVIVISCNQTLRSRGSYLNGIPKLRRSPGLVTNGLN